MAPKTKKEKEAIRSAFKEALQVSSDFVQSYWDLGGRLYQLYRGKLPTELSSSYCKVNLNMAYAAVQERIPKHMGNIFAQRDFVSLKPNSPRDEFYKEGSQWWLRDLLSNKIGYKYSLTGTLQAQEIFGTAYRMPIVYIDQDGKSVISSRPLDFFQVLPSPTGGIVNPHDNTQEPAIDWCFVVDWMTEDQIKKLRDNKFFDGDEVAAMLDGPVQVQGSGIDESYRDNYGQIANGIVQAGPSQWRSMTQGKDAEDTGSNMPRRRKIVYWMRRDKLTILGEDAYVLYDGEPTFKKGIIPVVKYSSIRDINNWFGISNLEMTEDILLAIMLNMNLRLQHLMQIMFPIKWIRSDVMGNHPRSQFDTDIGAIHSFPEGVNISEAIHYDRGQDAPQQSLADNSLLQFFLQETGGLKNFSKGMGGAGTLSNETATGITSIISEANARFFAESQQLEDGGVKDECKLLLMYANKYITSPQTVEVPFAPDGFNWATVKAEDISDAFEVITHGTAYLADRRETVQKLLAWLPILLQNPDLVDRRETLGQANQLMDVFPQPEKILIEQGPALAAAAQGGDTPAPGGLASALNLDNQNGSVENRNTVQAGGSTVSAGLSA